MIFYLLVFNRAGKVRLSKWHQNYNPDEKHKLVRTALPLSVFVLVACLLCNILT